MGTFVLVHGAWHAGWCWEKVAPRLEAAGHRVETPDLPGHGKNDGTPVPEVTLQAYVGSISRLLDELPEPAVLVGHSMGGLVVSEAAERRPDKIDTLVYLTAFLLRDGETLLQYAQADAESTVTQNLVVKEDEGVTLVRDEALREAFYAGCPDEDFEKARSLLVPQPLAPFVTPVGVSEGNFGRVPRVYVECLRDRAITIQNQRKMHANLPCREVVTMDTDHSPFYSAPEELADHLLSLARGGE